MTMDNGKTKFGEDTYLWIFLLAFMVVLLFGAAAMFQAFTRPAPECRCIYGPAPNGEGK
jgi:flagellar basal body-associated protein FliL